MTGLDESRRAEVLDAINEIKDPCSVAASVATGLADMGLVKSVEIAEDGRVGVQLMTTAPHCMYVGHFTLYVTEQVERLPWVTGVDVTFDHVLAWDESRMAEHARELMHTKHRKRLPLVFDSVPGGAAAMDVPGKDE
ncbi:iron-sulfur cluster assembly protein [Microbacterium sp. X-17]|uniref:metal-sulfur cluster assembly factor n=1 Tax=Microbacterium sp. X-17 TaxID=3144404 RepID=UPI0031F5A4E3